MGSFHLTLTERYIIIYIRRLSQKLNTLGKKHSSVTGMRQLLINDFVIEYISANSIKHLFNLELISLSD